MGFNQGLASILSFPSINIGFNLLREMMRLMAGMLMDAEVSSICGAEYRERSEERTNSRNGHR
ncbi:MAG: transposase, partial [Actinomycetota bacterium]